MNIKNRCYTVAVCKTKEKNSNFKLEKFQIIKNGWNYWVADPFPVEVNGKLYIFGEIYEYSNLKGSIGYTMLTEHGFTKWKTVIKEDYHLSFPNIFYLDSDMYMCPESQAGSVLSIYKCICFPDKWIKEKNIAENVRLTDTIFFEKNSEKYGISCEWKNLNNHLLKLFKIENDRIIFSDAKLNTLDSYYSRPAGKIFYDDILEKKLMVSQICKPKYGSGLIFKEFDLQFPYYKEKECYRVYPTEILSNKKTRWDGMHTFNTSENYIVIDLIWSRFNIIEKFYRLINRLKMKK